MEKLARRRPARSAKVVALVSSIASTLGVAMALGRADRSTVAPVTSATPLAPATTVRGPSTTVSKWVDGVYTGPAEPMRWGPVAVRVTVSGGRITAVDEVEYPQERSRSVFLTQHAQPVLESEAIAAQGANIQAVSGATYTSTAYAESLQAALDQAAALRRLRS